MTGANIFMLFPLQTSVSDFSFGGGKADSPAGFIILGVIVAVVIVVIIINAAKKSPGAGKTAAGGGGSKIFSGFALGRLARNIGLDGEQTKMLNFVFKTDDVIDPEKSINTPALLDRHFRKAYRIIEKSSADGHDIQNRLSVLFSTRNILETSSSEGLSSTRQLKDDTTLTFTHGKDKINVNVLSAKTDQLRVEVPKNVLGTQIKIPNGTKLSVLFFTNSNKGFSFETQVIGFSTLNAHPAMLLAHSNKLKLLSQRRFRRKQAVIACFMYLVYVEGSGKKQRLVVDKRRLNGNIADISVGGCSIKTTAPVQVGAKFKIEFTQGGNNVAALGQILRTNRAGINTIIHVKFLKMAKKSMNIINAFVYEYAADE